MTRTTSLADLRCELVPLAAASELSGSVLGAVAYSDDEAGPDVHAGYPSMSMAMTGGSTSGFAEVWRSTGEVVTGYYEGLAFAHDGEHLFCCGQIGEAADYLAPTEAAYVAALDLMRQLDYPQLVRMWNMVHGIVDQVPEGGTRYTRFCDGRGAAFEHCAVATARMPAATGVGSHAGGVSFYFLAGRTADLTHVENPRQISAYRYPTRYGVTPPSFARATYLAGRPAQLFISGTASIIGSETVHSDNLGAQCATTLENIAELVSGRNLMRHGIEADLTVRDIDKVKVYVKPGADLTEVRRICEATLSDTADVHYANVDMCRDDLLVEIEGIISNVHEQPTP
jgi:chorismatase